MSKQEVTRTFPDTEPQGLEPDKFRSYLSEAVEEYRRFLATKAPPRIDRTIYRVRDNQIEFGTDLFPYYRAIWEVTQAREALGLPKIRAFFDYIWSRGEFKKSLRGPDPKRESWELFMVQEVIHQPLCDILTEVSLEEAADSGEASPWKLPPAFFQKLINELIDRYCYGRTRFIARCPLGWFEAESGNSWDLGSGLRLCLYTLREKAVYLSRYHKRLPWWDSISRLGFEGVAVLEIVYEIRMDESDPRKTGKMASELLEKQIADLVDIVKWALMTGVGATTSLVEGTITYDNLLGGWIFTSGHAGFGAFKREEKHSGTTYNLTQDSLRLTRELISKALSYREKSSDIGQAFWHWGRACSANLDRDRLLESVIGLERILVAYPGESRYRFGLHGTALLTKDSDDAKSKAKELRRLYDKRSSAAHGSGGRTDRVKEADLAHKALGDSISSVLELFDRDFLKPEKKEGSLALQIEQWVLRNSPIRPKKGLEL